MGFLTDVGRGIVRPWKVPGQITRDLERMGGAVGGGAVPNSRPQLPEYVSGLGSGLVDVISDQYNNNRATPQYFGGQTFANFDPAQHEGQRQLLDYARGGLTDLSNSARGTFGSLTGGGLGAGLSPGLQKNISALSATGGANRNGMGNLLSGSLSPYYQNVISGGINDLQQTFQDTTGDVFDRASSNLFASDDNALLSGQFGGSSQALGQNQVADTFANEQGRVNRAFGNDLSQFSSGIYNQQFSDARNAQLGAHQMVSDAQLGALQAGSGIYNNEQNVRLGALGNATQLGNLGLSPGNVFNQVGGLRQGLHQRSIDDQVARHDYNRDIGPYAHAERLARLGTPLLTNTAFSQPGPPGPSRGQAAFSGAASGAAAGTAISPGWGTAIGAIGGGLMGYFNGSNGRF